MAEKLTFKEDPAAAEAFGFKEDPAAAAAFGTKARDTQGAAEAMRGRAKVARDEERAIDDVSAGPITTPKIPLVNLAGKPYTDTGNIAHLGEKDPITGAPRLLNTIDRTGLDEGNAELGKFNSGMRGIMAGAGIGSALASAPAMTATAKGSGGVVEKASEWMASAIKHSAESGNGLLKYLDLVKTAAPGAYGAATNVATKVLPAAIGTTVRAGTVAGATAAPSAASPISNMVERLRGSAAGNPRAGELMSKVDALMSMPQPTFPAASSTGTVTQSTLGNGS